jgi:hypothetical protein
MSSPKSAKYDVRMLILYGAQIMVFRIKANHFCGLSCSLCGLLVRVPGYRSRGYQIFSEVVGMERGPLSLERITEELLERKVAAPI